MQKNLRDYIGSSQQSLSPLNIRLDRLNQSDGDTNDETKKNIITLAKALIDFTYAKIESSRRRAFLEIVRMARSRETIETSELLLTTI